MNRVVPLVAFVLLAACARSPQEAWQNVAAVAPAAPATPAAPSADALAAKAVAQRYFDLLRRGDYPAAVGLWSRDSVTVTDGVGPFAAAMRARGRFDGQAGDPSPVSDREGTRYVLVQAAARITPKTGTVSDQAGVVMLKRAATDGAAWRIWGVDIRPRRCRQGETAQGLGCVRAQEQRRS